MAGTVVLVTGWESENSKFGCYDLASAKKVKKQMCRGVRFFKGLEDQTMWKLCAGGSGLVGKAIEKVVSQETPPSRDQGLDGLGWFGCQLAG